MDYTVMHRYRQLITQKQTDNRHQKRCYQLGDLESIASALCEDYGLLFAQDGYASKIAD